jgi:hypothetical protein
MIRLTLALAASICLISTASASLASRKEPPTLSKGRASKIATEAWEQAADRNTKSEFVLTDQTEILLNGKPCKYEQVPADAGITRMELAADNKTVRKIHFRTRK